MRPATTIAVLCALCIFTGSDPARADDVKAPPLIMRTNAFADGGVIPTKFAGFHGVQPGFRFLNGPGGTICYAIVLHDIDVSLEGGAGDVVHWVAWNIPAAARGVPEGRLPDGAVNGRNVLGKNSYGGPGAPAGPRYHHYVFELYALNGVLDLPENAGRDELLAAIRGRVLAKAAYVGRFRSPPGFSVGLP